MSLHLSNLAYAAGIVAFCLTPAFAQAMERSSGSPAPETNPNAITAPASGTCGSWHTLLSQLPGYKSIAALASADPYGLPTGFHVLVEPQSKDWVVINEHPSMGQCVVDQGRNMEYITELETVSMAPAFMLPENASCGPLLVSQMNALQVNDQALSLHGVNSHNKDFFFTRDGDNQWHVLLYQGTESGFCSYAYQAGHRSQFNADMMEIVYGKKPEVIMVKCPEDIMSVNPIPNAGWKTPNPELIEASETRPTVKYDLCYDSLA